MNDSHDNDKSQLATLDGDIQRELIRRAIEVRKLAYAPYSNFQVGAALLDRERNIHVGCNVENASLGLCICAERSAICSAVASGQTEFLMIAVAAAPLASPCGACRQFLFEFGDDILVISVNADQPDDYCIWRSGELLPAGFRL